MVKWRETGWRQMWQRKVRKQLPFWAERVQDAVWVYPADDGWHGKQGKAETLLADVQWQTGIPVAMVLPESEVLRHTEELPEITEDELAEIVRWEQANWFPGRERLLLRKQCLCRENGRCVWDFAAVAEECLPQTVCLPETTARVYVTERDALAYAIPAGTGTVLCADATPRRLYHYRNYMCTGSEIVSQEMMPAAIATVCGEMNWYVHTHSPATRQEYVSVGASNFPQVVEWDTTAGGMQVWQAADYLAAAIGSAAGQAALRWETGAQCERRFYPNRRILRAAAGILIGACAFAGVYAVGGWQEYMAAREAYIVQADGRARLVHLQSAEENYLATADPARRQPARSTLLVILADSAPPGVVFQELQAESGQVVLKGIFADLGELQRWQLYLRQRLQTEVRLKYERNQGNGGGFFLNWREVQDAANRD